MAHTCNFSTWETEAGGFLLEGWYRLYSKKKKTQKEKKKKKTT
jgi:hypothetical protein